MKNDTLHSPTAAADPQGFSRKMVHDMRNAIAPIRNAVQLLRFRVSADPALAPVTDMIERQVNEIVRMLNVISDADAAARPAAGMNDREERAAGVNDRGEAAAGVNDRGEAAAGSNDRGEAAAGVNDRGEPAVGGDKAGRNVLIADDNADLLTSLSGVLREAGHQVKTAADGVEAVALAQSWKPDFVLLDVHMPRMNGFEVAKQLRALFPPNVMKLVLMTGSSLDETTLRGAERAGFDHCLDKVHDFAEMEKLLRKD